MYDAAWASVLTLLLQRTWGLNITVGQDMTVTVISFTVISSLWFQYCWIVHWSHRSNYQRSEASGWRRWEAGCRSLGPAPTPRCNSSPEQCRILAGRAEHRPPASGSQKMRMMGMLSTFLKHHKLENCLSIKSQFFPHFVHSRKVVLHFCICVAYDLLQCCDLESLVTWCDDNHLTVNINKISLCLWRVTLL